VKAIESHGTIDTYNKKLTTDLCVVEKRRTLRNNKPLCSTTEIPLQTRIRGMMFEQLVSNGQGMYLKPDGYIPFKRTVEESNGMSSNGHRRRNLRSAR
jgi:hypothetical protein